MLVLPSRAKGGSRGPQQLDEPQERFVSKNEKRKLAQIARKKALRENLTQVGAVAPFGSCLAPPRSVGSRPPLSKGSACTAPRRPQRSSDPADPDLAPLPLRCLTACSRAR